MTNNQSPLNRRDAILDALAERMLDDCDMLELFELIAPLLSDPDRIDLAARLELCPMHFCDYRICADDNITACADYR